MGHAFWRAPAVAGVFFAAALAPFSMAFADTVFQEVTGRAAIEGRWFPQSAAHDGQRDVDISFLVEPEAYFEDEGGNSLTIKPFFRYDRADPRRTHFDMREFSALFFGDTDAGQWELAVGVDKVFWGVAESRHLVDVINQTDLIESADLEEKLGQPMVHATWIAEWGVAELFVLPYFRERTFPGRSGRIRTAIHVDTDQAQFESGAENWHHDFAARYSHSIGILDFGVSVFDGTNRDPRFQVGFDDGGGLVLVPVYDQMRQYSLDAQVTTGAWLLKLEALWREGELDSLNQEDDFGAFVTGVEYTFYGAFDTDWDVGLLGEWLFDDRDERATTPFENDVFLGARLAANDAESTDILFGVIQDLDSTSRLLFLESNRRIDDNWSLSVEGSAFMDIDRQDVLFDNRRDSLLQLEMTYNY